MSDSPTRRSSIPILKQTNKTKSFQSFVNLKIIDNNDSCESPAVELPKMPPKPKARTGVPNLEIDNDIVITKLCDENKRIKEHQIQLLSKYEEALRENMEIQNKNEESQKEIAQAKRELQNTENLLKQNMDMHEKYQKLRIIIEDMMPDSDVTLTSNTSSEGMTNQLEKLKSYMTNIELQLYEANESIADLIEKKQEIEAENVSLRNFVKMMQNNDHFGRNKKNENTNSDLVDTSRDLLDKAEPASDSISVKKEHNKRAFEAQFIEYV